MDTKLNATMLTVLVLRNSSTGTEKENRKMQIAEEARKNVDGVAISPQLSRLDPENEVTDGDLLIGQNLGAFLFRNLTSIDCEWVATL